jgi:hypothetical protein
MIDRKFERRRMTAPARRRIVELALARAYGPALRAISAPGLAGAAPERHPNFRPTI